MYSDFESYSDFVNELGPVLVNDGREVSENWTCDDLLTAGAILCATTEQDEEALGYEEVEAAEREVDKATKFDDVEVVKVKKEFDDVEVVKKAKKEFDDVKVVKVVKAVKVKVEDDQNKE